MIFSCHHAYQIYFFHIAVPFYSADDSIFHIITYRNGRSQCNRIYSFIFFVLFNESLSDFRQITFPALSDQQAIK